MSKRSWNVRIPWPDGTVVSLAFMFEGSFCNEKTWEGQWFKFLLERIVKLDRPHSPSLQYFELTFPLQEAVDAGLGDTVEELEDWLYNERSSSALLLGHMAWKGPGDTEGSLLLASGSRCRDGMLTMYLCPVVPWDWFQWKLRDSSALFGGKTCQSE